MRRMAVVTLGLLSVVLPARAGEIVEFKGAVLVRQEERAMMVFKVKNGEIKAQPSPGMKGVDLNGKVYSSSFAAAEKKEHALQLLKVGYEFGEGRALPRLQGRQRGDDRHDEDRKEGSHHGHQGDPRQPGGQVERTVNRTGLGGARFSLPA